MNDLLNTKTMYKRKNSYVIDGIFGPKTYEVLQGDPLWDVCKAHEKEHPECILAEPAPPAPTEEEIARGVRAQRNFLLAQCDWTQGADASQALGPKKISAWQNYRQALREIPSQKGFPHDIEWPLKPD